MMTEQVETRRRPFWLLVGIAIYVGIPFLSQRIDPIIKVSSAQHLTYAFSHFSSIVTNFSNGTMLSVYLINIMVMILWLFWIWAMLSLIVSIGLRVTHRQNTATTKRWVKVGALATFLVWQSFGHAGAVANKNINAAHVVSQPTAIVQTMQNTSATQPTTHVTVAPGETLWGIEQSANPHATPQQIVDLVNETATVNGITNPDAIFPGESIQVADLSAPATTPPVVTPAAPEAITLDAPVTPPPAITINAPTTGVESPIVLDGIHVNSPAIPQSGSTTASLAESLIAMGLLAGASVVAVKRFRKRQMQRRPKGMVPVAPDPVVYDELVSLRDAEDLYLDTLRSLSVLTALGAPRLDSVLVGPGELVAHLETDPEAIPSELASFVTYESETRAMRFARPLPELALNDAGLPYGGLLYLGVDPHEQAHVFVNAAGRGVVGLPNASDDVWRAIYSQFAWTDWLRSNATFFYRSRAEFELPSDQLNESNSVIAGLADFSSDLATESDLRAVVNRALAEASSLQANASRASLTNARMEADLTGMDVILAKNPIGEQTLTQLVNAIARTESMVMLVAQDAPEVWSIDANGILNVPSHTGDTLRIRPASMSVASMMQHVAFLQNESTFIANTLSVQGLANNAQPMLQYFGTEIGLHPTLSPLANRMALILGIRHELPLRELALSALPGLDASSGAFGKAITELGDHLGQALTISNGTARLDAAVGSDLGQLFASTNLRAIATLLTSRPMAYLRDDWSFAALYGERLDALLIDHLVNIALSVANTRPDASIAIHDLLVKLMGSTDRIELISVAVTRAQSGAAPAMAEWSKISESRRNDAAPGTDITFDPGIMAELHELLGASA